MKHLYTLLIGLTVSTFALSQSLERAQMGRADYTRQASNQQINTVGADRDLIYSNDFSNCSDWVLENANDDYGLTDYVEGINFECSTEGPTGPYNGWAGGTAGSPAPAPNFETADNGFLIVDSDLFGAEEAYETNWIENNMATLAAPIDLTGHPAVIVEFANQYRCWDNTADVERCYLEISLDGVNWPDISTLEEDEGFATNTEGEVVGQRWEVFPEADRGWQSEDAEVRRFDITDLAGDQPAVYLRLRWVGQWGYAWMIDDLVVFDTPANDLRVGSYVSHTDYQTSGVWEARNWPYSQTINMNFGLTAANMGTATQMNSTLNVTINGVDAGTSDGSDIEYSAWDTLRVNYTPMETTGTYDVVYTIASDSVDQYPDDNVASDQYAVSEFSYGRDNGVLAGLSPSDGTVDYLAAVPYDIFAEQTIYGIDVAIMDASEAETDVVCHLFDWAEWNNGGDQYSGLMATSEELAIESNFLWSGDGEVVWYTFAFDDPYTAEANSAVMAVFEHLGGTNVQIGISLDQEDQTIFVYGPFGTGSAYDWYYSTGAYMVRLNLDPNCESSVAVNEIEGEGFSLGNAYPNPAGETARVKFNLDHASNVSFQVMDITGALVLNVEEGRLPAGVHSTTLNVEGLTSGLYTYTIIVDGARATSKLVIK